jgi:hypothetical protein
MVRVRAAHTRKRQASSGRLPTLKMAMARLSAGGGKRTGCFRAPSVWSGRSFRRPLTAARRPLLPMRAATPGDRYAVIPVIPSNAPAPGDRSCVSFCLRLLQTSNLQAI